MASYLRVVGGDGNYASAPHIAAYDITGDIDVRVKVSLDDWTPAGSMALVTQYGSGANTSWGMRITNTGLIHWRWDNDTSVVSEFSDALGFTDGTVHWLRVTMDVDNGSSNYDVTYYKSDNGVDWTQIGAVDHGAAATQIATSTAPIEIGSDQDGDGSNAIGNYYCAQVYDGIGGTLVFDADFTAEQPGTTSFTESSAQEATVTINQSGDPQAEIIEDPDNPWSTATEAWSQLFTSRGVRVFPLRVRPQTVEVGHTESTTPNTDTT